MSLARDAGAIAAALGALALLAPLPAGASRRREALRVAGALALIAGALVVLASLVPADDARAAVGSPARAAAMAAAVLAAAGLVAALARLVVARPVAWFALLGVALPIRVPVSLGSLEANLLVPLYLVIAIGVVAWAWGRARGRVAMPSLGPPAITLPLALFLAWVFASALWSTDPQEAGIKVACFYAPFTILYALVLAFWPHARALAALVVTALAGASVAAALALFQFWSGALWWNDTLIQANVYSRFFRVNGFFYDPNILGRYLAMAMLVALALAWTRRRGPELAGLAAALALMAGGLFVTYSRSSTLMLMIGIVLLSARAAGPRRVAAAAGAALAVAAALTFATSSEVREAATDLDRLERVSEGRFGLMRGGLTIWRGDPVEGTGLGSFAQEFEETLTDSERARIRVVISHNTPVTVLSEGGLIGFALFCWLLGGAGWAAVRGSREQGGGAGWARWCAGAILLGIVAHSLLYAALFEDPFVWVLAAGAVALAASTPARPGGDDRPDPDAEPEAGPREALAT